MGWETRRGRLVYYRKVRVGRRVRSIYCGGGERGERAAREDEARRSASRNAGIPVEDTGPLEILSHEPGKTETPAAALTGYAAFLERIRRENSSAWGRSRPRR